MSSQTVEKDKTCMGIGPVPDTVRTSTIFIQKITAIVLSTVFYSKGFFSEKDYSVRIADGIPLNIIKSSKKCPGAACVVKWMEGAFEAVEKRYLKQMFLEITDESGNLLEMYTMKYTYNDTNTTCTLEQGQKGEVASLEDTQLGIRLLLRNLMTLSSLNGTLSPTASCLMKLQYTDDTPPDYEPVGFRPLGDEPRPAFKGKPESWRLGEVPTRFHSMTISCKESNPKSRSTEEKEKSGNPTPYPHNNMAHDSKSLNAQGKALHPVKCVCGVKEEGEVMINCNKCCTSQHGACYKIISVEEIPHQHVCMDCSSQDTPDSAFLGRNAGAMSKDNCLYRCALLVCLKSSRLTVANLAQELHIDNSKALTLMKRLLGDIALHKSVTHGPSLDAPNRIFRVDAARVEFELIPQHFKNLQACTSEKVPTLDELENMQIEDSKNTRREKKRKLPDQELTGGLPEIQRKKISVPRSAKLRQK